MPRMKDHTFTKDELESQKKKRKNAFRVIDSNDEFPEIKELKTVTKVLDTHVNLKWLLDKFDTTIHYNLMNRRREIAIPGLPICAEDTENHAMSMVNYIATLNGMPTASLHEHIAALALENAYHPIVECIKKNPWDGTPRLDDFIKTIKSPDAAYAYQIIKTFMVAAIAAAHSVDGFINQGVLVIQGPQGIGKTSWIKKLDPIGCSAVKEGVTLDPASRDSIVMAASYWIIELGELDATFRKSDISRIKSYITMQFDHVRRSHARHETLLARRTVYIASVNEDNFLSDETGNRRWWTIPATEIDYQHDFNMIQVWAEVYYLWRQGASPYLSREMEHRVNILNVEHEKIDPLKEILLKNYDWESTARREMTATAMLIEIGYTKPTRAEATKMGALLKSFTGKKATQREHGNVQEVPFPLLNRFQS